MQIYFEDILYLHPQGVISLDRFDPKNGLCASHHSVETPPFHFSAGPLTFWNGFLYPLARSCRKSPRLRHGIRKPRPSSVELSTDLKDVSEGEDVFYTYRASVSSSKDSEGDASLHQLVSVTTNRMCFLILLLGLHCLAPVVLAGRFYGQVIAVHRTCFLARAAPMLCFHFFSQS